MLTPTLPTDRKPPRVLPRAMQALLDEQMQQPTTAIGGDPPGSIQRVQRMPLAPYQAPQRLAPAAVPDAVQVPLPDAPTYDERGRKTDRIIQGVGTLGALVLAGTPAGAFAGGVAHGSADSVDERDAYYRQAMSDHQATLDAIIEGNATRQQDVQDRRYDQQAGLYEYDRNRRDALADDRRSRRYDVQDRDYKTQAQIEADQREAEAQAQRDAILHGNRMEQIGATNAGALERTRVTQDAITARGERSGDRSSSQYQGSRQEYQRTLSYWEQQAANPRATPSERAMAERQVQQYRSMAPPPPSSMSDVTDLRRQLQERGIGASGDPDVIRKARATGLIGDEEAMQFLDLMEQ